MLYACYLTHKLSRLPFLVFLASQWVDFRDSPRRTSGLTSPDTTRLKDASMRAITASLRHLRYCPLQTRMSEHGTIWGSKISSFGFSHKLVIVTMNEGDWILMERHEFPFTQLLYVHLSYVFFPGVCFFFKHLCWMVCTDSTSVRTCVLLFMHAHSLPLAGLFDLALFTPLYPSRREMLVPSCRTLLKPDRISSNP